MCNAVHQKWGHTSCQMRWIKNPRNSTIVYYKRCRVRWFQNFIHQFCVCQGFSWLQDLLLISRWWWWDGQKLRPSFRVGIISETHCSTGLESWLTNFFLGIIWKMCSSGVKSSPRPICTRTLVWPHLWSLKKQRWYLVYCHHNVKFQINSKQCQ